MITVHILHIQGNCYESYAKKLFFFAFALHFTFLLIVLTGQIGKYYGKYKVRD